MIARPASRLLRFHFKWKVAWADAFTRCKNLPRHDMMITWDGGKSDRGRWILLDRSCAAPQIYTDCSRLPQIEHFLYRSSIRPVPVCQHFHELHLATAVPKRLVETAGKATQQERFRKGGLFYAKQASTPWGPASAPSKCWKCSTRR